MSPTNVIWTNEDFEVYARQLELITKNYPELPREICERRAADIVNNQKGL